MRTFATAAVLAVLAAGSPRPAPAAPQDEAQKMAIELLEKAAAEYQGGKYKEAREIATKAVKLDPKNPAGHYVIGSASLKLRDNEAAAEAFREMLRLDPDSAIALDRLGDALLKMGKFAEAVESYDAYLKVRPKDAPDHWRGIALYYAGKFKEGVEQFELHRTVNPEDVENSAWHYLCNARATSPAKAREQLIPVTKDARVPMKEVLELFAGKVKPADVMAAAEDTKLEGARQKSARFYANLYVALYYESEGDAKKTLEHLTAAVEKYEVPDYMWDVAAAHLKTLTAKKE